MPKGTQDYSLTKRAFAKQNFSEQQIVELQNCMDQLNGPAYFMEHFVKIQHPTKGGIKFEPFEFQERLIHTYSQYRYSINMLPRQTGKTTCAAAYLLWYAMFVADSTILVAAHKHTGAQEIMQRIRYAYESVPDHIRAGVTEYNKGSLSFDNGSRIVSATTTENTGRGMSLSLVYLDEFAFVPPRIAAEFWTALSPTLSTGGKCIVTSTPNSDDDTFANIWHQAIQQTDDYGEETDVGSNGFKAFRVNWQEHPDRDELWAKAERSRIGEERFRREHECEFIIYDETLIDSLKLVDMKGIDPIRRSGQIRWYENIDPNKIYTITLDPSTGTGGDNAAIVCYDLPSMNQVCEWQHNKTPIEGQVKLLREVAKELQSYGATEIYWTVENNAIGEAALVVIRDTGEESFPGTFLHEPNKVQGKKGRKGYHTHHKNKMEGALAMKRLIESNKLTLRSKNIIRELKEFVARGTTFAAKPGGSDDLVMATLVTVRMITYIAQYEDAIYDEIETSVNDDDDFNGPLPIGVL
jgi:hypothetical protein